MWKTFAYLAALVMFASLTPWGGDPEPWQKTVDSILVVIAAVMLGLAFFTAGRKKS